MFYTDVVTLKSTSKEIPKEKMPLPLIKQLVDTYYDFQDQRIITSNRIMAAQKENGFTDEQLEKYGVKELLAKAEDFEDSIKKRLAAEVQNYEIYSEYLSKIQGIGPIISAGLIANIQDPKRFENPSKLWQYGGLGMNTYCDSCGQPTYVMREIEDMEGNKRKVKALSNLAVCPDCGKETRRIIQKRAAGYQSNWNDRIKVLSWKISSSFVKQKGEKSGYRRIYDSIKEEERRRHPEKEKTKAGKTQYNDGHIHNRAMRKVAKIFLANLLLKWQEMEGIEPTSPYIAAEPHHTMIKPFIDKK